MNDDKQKARRSLASWSCIKFAPIKVQRCSERDLHNATQAFLFERARLMKVPSGHFQVVMA
jgi:hypothetical protein